jgi:4-hydroxy-tetrahydrodipicolinate reductase
MNAMADTRRLRCLSVGFGTIGAEIARLVLEREDLELVGAVDVAPHLVGRDVADLVGLQAQTGVIVQDSIRSCPPADLVLHSTGSHLPVVARQLRGYLDRGLDCISTCEELTWPFARHPELSAELDALAKARGGRLLGTGINPGFVMDLLPMVLTVPCRRVKHVLARRIVDTSTRRPQLQQKTGLGLTEAEFCERAERGTIGHVGLYESAGLLATGLGWRPDAIVVRLEPLLAKTAVETHHLSVQEGQVVGQRQTATAAAGGDERVRLELEMAFGRADPHDEVRITGEPGFALHISGGIPGDEATPACVVNVIPSLLAARAGLLTANDLVVPRWRSERE